MEFKGTKGKWEADFDENESYTVVNTSVYRIAEAKHFTSQIDVVLLEPTFEEGRANALLISKAPEMLEMLKKIVSIESIICLGGAIDEQYIGEEETLNIMMNEVKQLIKEATEL